MDVQDYFRQYEQPWKAGFEQRLQMLPEALAQVVRDRLKDTQTWRENDKRQKAFAEALAQADDKTLRDICAVLFPQFPDLVARAYQKHRTSHPYTSGYARRAFRSLEHPASALAAAEWLWELWNLARAYPQDIEWFAVSAGLMNPWSSQGLGLLFAQAIDDGDRAVLQVLKDTASTQHPVARMGRHVPAALLASRSDEAHAYAEGLLLAAQRQEGLRQVILESVDEASLPAFIRLLDVILREDLLRFAATLRAACVWFGLNYDVTDLKTVKKLLGQALNYLQDEPQARAALSRGDGVSAYLALFCLGMRDALKAGAEARPLLTDADPARRMAAVQFLQAAQLLEESELNALLGDPDIRLAAVAGQTINRWNTDTKLSFEEYAAYAERLPKEGRLEPLLFPWLGQIPAQSDALDCLPGLLNTRRFELIVPYLGGLSSYGKTALLERLEKHAKATKGELDATSRDLLLTLLQDRNSGVSERAVMVMTHLTPNAAEVKVAHTLLKRKSADLRRGLIRLLVKDRTQGERSAAELLSTSNTEQRQAGLQILLEIAGTPPADFTPKNVTEESLLGKLTQPDLQLSLKDGLGLFDPQQLSQPEPVLARDRDYPADVRRGAKLLQSLDDLVNLHRETPLVGVGWDGTDTALLMNVQPWQIRARDDQPMPLADLWQRWWAERPDAQDGDTTRMAWALAHYVARADTTETELAEELENDLDAEDLAQMDAEDLADYQQERQAEQHANLERQSVLRRTIHRTLGPLVPLKLLRPQLLEPLLAYLQDQYAGDLDTQMQMDAWETALSYLPRESKIIGSQDHWRQIDPRDLLNFLEPDWDLDTLAPAELQRYWQIKTYRNMGFPNLPRQLPLTALLLLAYAHGWATQADLYHQLIGERDGRRGGYSYSGGAQFGDLHEYTRRKLREKLPTHPDWTQAVSKVRERVLEVELGRGDLETPATEPALALQSVHGAALTLRLLAGMGKNPLKRGYQWNNQSKDAAFSHLLRVSFPLPSDTPNLFGQQVGALKIKDTRLLDLAMFAPQWANLISQTVGWRGLQDGVYWLHAHTKDRQWSVPEDIRQAWEAEISERTPLSAGDLMEGAVDVAWFRQTYKALGAERFNTLLDAAKYASSSGGHKRAELFAQAILGELAEADLQSRIKEKRNQDAVRAIGLLPLSKSKAKAAAELEGRYRLLSDFRREAKQFGAQRQASERLAADIGLQNLARSAGYSDPQRLMWAMEARMAPDWAQVVEVDGLTLRIALTPSGDASLVMERGDKTIKTLPPALKKRGDVIAIRAAVKELEATRQRMRAALEEAMVRGDHFQNAELRDLAQHPVIAPMLQNLIWVLNEGHLGWWQGDQLQTLSGALEIGDQALRIAHPHDLYAAGHWPEFQAHIMTQGLTQPFKQAFREYYPLTVAEQEAKRSRRYAGHHVGPSKAAALFKTRGWVAVPEEGVRKTYHAEGLNVWVDTAVGYGTPSEVEGAELHAVYFVQRDAHEPMPLADVPPRLFSETMRDLDLVVSVAHTGGVDPEATQSTVEMRADLLRETLRLLKLKNVRLENNHALIDGHYSHYTVHLGSGTVHRQPGGFLCVVPVHNQHTGRLFLPFADPDPKTAEVVSKVLLLAEDKKIVDPTILEQLR